MVTAAAAAGAVSVAAVPLHLRPGVREHYLGWLASARPDLVLLYEDRFRRGAYRPRAEGERLSALVDAALAEAPGRPAALRASFGHRGPSPGDVGRHPAAGARRSGAEQLRLL